jgi:hypothetical protein
MKIFVPVAFGESAQPDGPNVRVSRRAYTEQAHFTDAERNNFKAWVTGGVPTMALRDDEEFGMFLQELEVVTPPCGHTEKIEIEPGKFVCPVCEAI